ncbi:hypothetical protein RRG08_041769 [Elysia crispata]|uniref:Uncharacterized protein n=1 Tax=Elysia crispata TaxID=231223 RepID=A0AAE0YJL0_9GAST|nr:hypothetical protein RRG08_041769 [Elysia crispata]
MNVTFIAYAESDFSIASQNKLKCDIILSIKELVLVKLNRDDHGDDVNSSNDQMEEDREGDTLLNVEYYVGDRRLQWHNDKVYNLNKDYNHDIEKHGQNNRLRILFLGPNTRFKSWTDCCFTLHTRLSITRHVRSSLPKVFEPASHLPNPTLPEQRPNGPFQALLG